MKIVEEEDIEEGEREVLERAIGSERGVEGKEKKQETIEVGTL